MLQFPSSRNDWRFDVVSILAVLGESNVRLSYQMITASEFCLLPRLIPAPQAFLREKRPEHLESERDVGVYGAHSGNQRQGINYLPNMLLETDSIPAYTVREVTINKTEPAFDVRIGSWKSPLNLLSICSCVLSIGLVIWAALLRDGVALIGVLLMAIASSALGLASLWKQSPPNLMYEDQRRQRETEDIIVHLRWGAFVVVHCDSEIARRLYWAPEKCVYKVSDANYRLSGGVLAGLAITVAIVLFGNCGSVMQIAIGISYALLNVIYWLISTLPPIRSWDLRGLEVKPVDYKMSTFTSAVWRAIQSTRSSEWVRSHRVLPETSAWGKWLDEADCNIGETWDCEQALTRHLREEVENPLDKVGNNAASGNVGLEQS